MQGLLDRSFFYLLNLTVKKSQNQWNYLASLLPLKPNLTKNHALVQTKFEEMLRFKLIHYFYFKKTLSMILSKKKKIIHNFH